MTDKVGAAIAAAAAEPEPVPMVTLEVSLGSGRRVGVVMPLDLRPIEMVELLGRIALEAPAHLTEASARQRGAAILATPTGPHLVRPT